MPLIGDRVKHERTGLYYTFMGWDEDTLDGQMVALVQRIDGTESLPVVWNERWWVEPQVVVINDVEFLRGGTTSQGGYILEETYFSTKDNGIYFTIDYRYSKKGHK